MLSMESMIDISSRRGVGGQQTFPGLRSRIIFALFRSFLVPGPGPCCEGHGPGEGNHREES